MVVSCAAYGCTNRQTKKLPGVTFHRFPKDPLRRAKWAKVIHRAEWQPSDYDRICSVHFEDKVFDRTGQTVRLKDGAEPTIFEALPSYLQTKVHFEESQWESHRADGWRKLKPNAVPTIFNVPNPPKKLTLTRRSHYKVPRCSPKKTTTLPQTSPTPEMIAVALNPQASASAVELDCKEFQFHDNKIVLDIDMQHDVDSQRTLKLKRIINRQSKVIESQRRQIWRMKKRIEQLNNILREKLCLPEI